MRVTIPDDLADALQAKLSPAQTLEGEVTRLLQAASHVPAGDQVQILCSAQLNDLAMRLGRPSLRNYADLVNTVDRLASLHFNAIRFGFSPGQLEEIQHKAEREGMTVEEYSARIIRTLTSQFFSTHPAREEWPHMALDLQVAGPADPDQLIQIT